LDIITQNFPGILTGNYDEVATQWAETDPENEVMFTEYVNSVVDSNYDLMDENGQNPLTAEFERLKHLFQGDYEDAPHLATRPKSGRILWPEWCHQIAEKYRGPHTDFLNLAWIKANFSDPVECRSMFRDPRVVSKLVIYFSLKTFQEDANFISNNL